MPKKNRCGSEHAYFNGICKDIHVWNCKVKTVVTQLNSLRKQTVDLRLASGVKTCNADVTEKTQA